MGDVTKWGRKGAMAKEGRVGEEEEEETCSSFMNFKFALELLSS